MKIMIPRSRRPFNRLPSGIDYFVHLGIIIFLARNPQKHRNPAKLLIFNAPIRKHPVNTTVVSLVLATIFLTRPSRNTVHLTILIFLAALRRRVGCRPRGRRW